MTKIDNKFRSKVFKAAWTSLRNGKSSDLSQALKSAWTWAKNTLAKAWNLWRPKQNFMRFYVGENYVQISLKERSPRGSYENHRSAKGETGFFTAWYKLVGVTEEYFTENISDLMTELPYHTNMIESKF